MVFGNVSYFNRVKLFGFIAADNGKDYWFHASGVQLPGPWAARKVKEGDRVQFEIGINRNRGSEMAVNVAPVSGGDGR